ncbi:hypothetical protein C2G38_2206775 [Gigaspora rosea]|uniref:Uncharacterized protein n=1 Tax=Gigaspora rosea TaxID=44941 RepID=A0A397UJ06_9GLOM|nr:hypothetical protein C2G38_2206775 [Gigaspora rosea]
MGFGWEKWVDIYFVVFLGGETNLMQNFFNSIQSSCDDLQITKYFGDYFKAQLHRSADMLYKINIVSARHSISPSMSSQRATPSCQNYHRHLATPSHQNYHRRSITPPRYSRQINRNYQNIESHSCRSISPNKCYHSRRRSRSPDEKDKEISFLKSTVESLINEVNKLKSDKATTSNDLSEFVDVDDTETTGVMGQLGFPAQWDNMGFCDLDANETTIAPCDANEATVAPCDNTNSDIATSSVNPSNKKGKQSEDHNVPANNLRKPSVTPEPPFRYMKKSREYLEEMTVDQYKLFHDEVIQILNGLDDSLQLDPTKT